MTDKSTPVGRMVQGSVVAQQRTDMATRQKLWMDAAKTIPDMGTFFSVAFPKLIDGKPNSEFAAFYADLGAIAQASWPQFFSNGQCTNPKFSFKVVDGDGNDGNGQSLAGKPGFAGHYIVKFDSNYPIKSFYEGKFSPTDEIGLLPNTPKADSIIKRGHYIRVIYEAKSNNADLTKQQVPGISIYPKLVSYIGGRPQDEITSGPDAQEAFGAAPVGWRPEGVSAVPGAPLGAGGGLALPGATPALPASPGLALPGVGGGLALPGAAPALSLPTPAAPTYVVRADLAQQGHTLASMVPAVGTIEQLLAAGYITQQAAPAGLALPVATPALTLPTPAAPSYQLTDKARAAVPGCSIESLTAAGNGWTVDMLVQHGYAVKVG